MARSVVRSMSMSRKVLPNWSRRQDRTSCPNAKTGGSLEVVLTRAPRYTLGAISKTLLFDHATTRHIIAGPLSYMCLITARIKIHTGTIEVDIDQPQHRTETTNPCITTMNRKRINLCFIKIQKLVKFSLQLESTKTSDLQRGTDDFSFGALSFIQR